MRRELKYAVVIIMTVFINTIISGCYAYDTARVQKLENSITQQNPDNNKSHTPYNLYSQVLNDVVVEKCSTDYKPKSSLWHIVNLSALQVATASYLVHKERSYLAFNIKSRDYYIFGLRKIVV